MKVKYLLEHRGQLNARLEEIEAEKAQLVRKLKALDILLEGSRENPKTSLEHVVKQSVMQKKKSGQILTRKHRIPAHAVRFSDRISLIGAVQEVAMKQPGTFDSNVLLKALQSAYPEFHLGETKHISSPLSDLVKKGVLVMERKRLGSRANIYRAVQTAK